MQNSDQVVVNMPSYSILSQSENDVFIYTGYIRPGKHTIFVYDPQIDCFFK